MIKRKTLKVAALMGVSLVSSAVLGYGITFCEGKCDPWIGALVGVGLWFFFVGLMGTVHLLTE